MAPDSVWDRVLLKILVVGDPGTGKTTTLRMAGEGFTDLYISTNAIDFKKLTLELDNKIVTLYMWDTSGTDNAQAIATANYQGAHAFIICYDVVRQETFDSVPHWIKQAGKHGPPDAVLMLLGTKSDLTEEKVVSYETAKTFADENGILLFEVSAKNGTNIELALVTLCAIMKKQRL